jgi:radical SAM-linked protein
MHIRITFAKTEAMRYTSHLDLQRALERTLRRASLPLAYTQGFSPHARINIASALPLGFTSDGEIIDLWLDESLPVEKIHAALDAAAPPGIEIHRVQEIIAKEPALQTQVQAAEYTAVLRETIPDLAERVTALLAAETLPRERRGKRYDLRPLIETLSAEGDERNRLTMRLGARANATGRPEEVLDALGIPHHMARIQRTRILCEIKK